MIRIKICGITTLRDLDLLAGADAIGLNFHPGSPRCIGLPLAQSLLRRWHGVSVGVIVKDFPPGTESLPLSAIQTYSPSLYSLPLPMIPAFRVQTASDLASIPAYLKANPATPAVLIDGSSPGSGLKAPWELLAGFSPGVPWILAGGLTPENVAGAISLCRPDGVDVASGVEAAPGVKDPAKVKDFIQAAHAAFSAL